MQQSGQVLINKNVLLLRLAGMSQTLGEGADDGHHPNLSRLSGATPKVSSVLVWFTAYVPC